MIRPAGRRTVPAISHASRRPCASRKATPATSSRSWRATSRISTAALMADGLSQEQAERNTLARLGAPDVLAGDLRRARQTSRRMIAAVGGGVWAATRSGTFGLLVGAATALPVMLLIAAIVGLLLPSVSFLFEPVGIATGIAWAWAIAAFLAAGAATRRIAVTARRPIADVRTPAALLAALVIGAAVLLIPSQALDEVAVIVLLAIPLGGVLGALLATERGRPSRWLAPLAILVMVFGFVALPLAILWAPPTVTCGPIVPSDHPAFEAEPAFESPFADGMGMIIQNQDGRYELETTVGPSIAQWRDLRLEVWACALPCSEPDAERTVLIGDAPASIANDRLTAAVVMNRYRYSGPIVALLRGTDEGGVQHTLFGPDIGKAAFVGRVIDWLSAPEPF